MLVDGKNDTKSLLHFTARQLTYDDTFLTSVVGNSFLINLLLYCVVGTCGLFFCCLLHATVEIKSLVRLASFICIYLFALGRFVWIRIWWKSLTIIIFFLLMLLLLSALINLKMLWKIKSHNLWTKLSSELYCYFLNWKAYVIETDLKKMWC